MYVSNRFMDKYFKMGFLGGIVVKNPPANEGDARDVGSIPGLGRLPGEGNGNPLQYSWLGNPMDCSLPGSSVHGCSRQEYWSGLPFPSPVDLSNPGIEPTSLASPALAGRFFTTVPPGKTMYIIFKKLNQY